MSPLMIWGLGFIFTICVIASQVIFPFAFDFVSTLFVYGCGVYVGRVASAK